MAVKGELIGSESDVHHAEAAVEQGIDDVELAIVAGPARDVEPLLVRIVGYAGWDRDVAPLEGRGDLPGLDVDDDDLVLVIDREENATLRRVDIHQLRAARKIDGRDRRVGMWIDQLHGVR